MPWVLTADIKEVQWRCPDCNKLSYEAQTADDCCVRSSRGNLDDPTSAKVVELNIRWPDGQKATLTVLETSPTDKVM